MSTASRNIIKDFGPTRYRISDELRKVLNANGMQAQIGFNENGSPILMASAHDSVEPHVYHITQDQFESLTRGGYASLNRQAYQTFVSIVSKDFHIPYSYVAAKEANSPVNMGQWGKEILPGETGYGYVGTPPLVPFNGSRFGRFDRFVYGMANYGSFMRSGLPLSAFGSPYRPFYVNERKGGYLRPGELPTGSCGFYDKGRETAVTGQRAKSATQDIKIDSVAVKHLERPKGKAIPINDGLRVEASEQPRQFLNILASHGLSIKTTGKGERELVIMSDGVDKNLGYKIDEEDFKKLTSCFPTFKKDKHGKEVKASHGMTVDDRLAILNKYVTRDFTTPVTKAMLESRDYVQLKLKPEVARELKLDADGRVSAVEFSKNLDVIDIKSRRKNYTDGFVDKWNSIGIVDGHTLDKGQGFYLPRSHGRRLSVGEIQAYQYNDGKKTGWRMTAVISGKPQSKDIKERDYIRFLNSDDKHRLEQFADTFSDVVDIRSSSNGKLEDEDLSRSISQSAGASRLKGSYSLIGDNYQAYLTDVMALKDSKSGNCTINVRTSKDAGVWSYAISEEQYKSFTRGDDQAKVKILTEVIPFTRQDKTQGQDKTQSLVVVDNAKVPLELAERAARINDNVTSGELEEHTRAVCEAHHAYILSVLPSVFRSEKDADLDKLADYMDKNHRLPSELSTTEVTKVNKVLERLRKEGLYNQEVANALNKTGLKPEVVFKGLTSDELRRLGLSPETAAHIVILQGKTLDTLQMQARKALGHAGDKAEEWKDLNGAMLKGNHEWKRGGSNGRSTTIGSITAAHALDDAGHEIKGKYILTAIVDGNPISHEINQKTFDKLGALDNEHRLKLFDKIFPEIEMRRKPGTGFHLGSMLLGALDAVRLAAGTGLMMSQAFGRPEPRPEFYVTRHTFYGTDQTAAQTAKILFDADMQTAIHKDMEKDLGRGV